jgi:glycosyltransferase involved in cell wall biosynthesis
MATGSKRPLKVAILGTRGVPPAYGGFETFAGELSTRLLAHGHEVSVYCRPSRGADHDDAILPDGSWRGVRRIVVPAVMGSKYLETVSHTFLSAIDAVRRDFDVVLLCNAANAFVLPLLRSVRVPVVINVDGIERKRRKWNVLGRAVYAIGESFSVLFSNRVVADAHVISRYYARRHGIEPVMIPYGAEFPAEPDADVLARLGLAAGAYLLYVSRFEPENNPLEVLRAYGKFRASQAGKPVPPLVMVGSASYAPELERALRSEAGQGVMLPGALYGNDYRTLQRRALLYIQATEVGGTHPALIEAMGSGGCVLANDTPENREVGGDAIGYFRLRNSERGEPPEETLSGMLSEWLANGDLRRVKTALARARAAELFGWERVSTAYEELFLSLA